MPQMIKALVKREASRGIWMDEVPMPEIGPNVVLIKLEKTAICGTDLHIYKWDEWSQRTGVGGAFLCQPRHHPSAVGLGLVLADFPLGRPVRNCNFKPHHSLQQLRHIGLGRIAQLPGVWPIAIGAPFRGEAAAERASATTPPRG